MSEQFTNRRGHSLSIDDDGPGMQPQQPIVSVPEPVRRPVKRRRRRQVVIPWKWIFIVVGIALAVILGTFEFARFTYASSVSGAKDQIKNLVATDVANASKQTTMTSATLASLSDKFKDISMSLCPGGLLDNYATIYPRAKQALSDCTAYRTKVEALVTALSTMSDEAKYLEQLQSIISPVTQPLPDQFAVLNSQLDNWKSVSTGLKAVIAPVSFQKVHSAFLQRIDAVVSIWIDLVAASNDQDSAKFSAAQAKLTDSYAAVRSSADELESMLGSTQTQLSAAYSALQ